jgi:hypothetical protein
MTAFKSLSAGWRSVCMTLAVLALVLKVAVPAGYMVDTSAAGAPAIVLCTAQGAVTITQPGDHHRGPEAPAGSTHDAPCAFAGHGAAFVAVEPVTVGVVEHVVYAPLAAPTAVEAVPGRGLAAPPLPARGPPQVA